MCWQGIGFLEIHSKMGSNGGLLKMWKMKDISWKCKYGIKTFMGFEFLGWRLDIHFLSAINSLSVKGYGYSTLSLSLSLWCSFSLLLFLVIFNILEKLGFWMLYISYCYVSWIKYNMNFSYLSVFFLFLPFEFKVLLPGQGRWSSVFTLLCFLLCYLNLFSLKKEIVW